MSKPLTDEEFAALQQRLDAETQRRAAETQARIDAALVPLQAIAHGPEAAKLVADLRATLSDPVVTEQRNWRIAIDSVIQTVENLGRVIPAPQ